VHVRLSDDEHARLAARAALGGVSPPRLLVDTALSPRPGVVERRAAQTMFLGARRQLVGMGTNLNQLAKVANSNGQVPPGLAEALAAVAAMQDVVERAAAAVEQAGAP
jgi:hypothetical protein